jgi:hypothetical protein
MMHVRAVNAISGDGTGYYLCEARPGWRFMHIPEYNDRCQSYDRIRALIDRARVLAQAELAAAAPVRFLDVVPRAA